ncbi:hypothetical protein Emag_003332 [Eimeria magna]
MEDVTVSQQTTFELEEIDDWLEDSLEGSSYSSEPEAVEAFPAGRAETSVKAEAVKTTRQYAKRRAFLSVLAVVASGLLLAMPVRKQPQLVGAKFPGVPKKDPEKTPIKFKDKPTGFSEGSDEDSEKEDGELKVEPPLLEFEEEIDDLVEWVRQMPAPKDKTLHRPELEKNKFEEVACFNGLKYIFSGKFRMAALVLEGLPKLIEKCSANAEDARRHSREHAHYKFFGDWERAELVVSVTAAREVKVNWVIAAGPAATTAAAAKDRELL